MEKVKKNTQLKVDNVSQQKKNATQKCLKTREWELRK